MPLRSYSANGCNVSMSKVLAEVPSGSVSCNHRVHLYSTYDRKSVVIRGFSYLHTVQGLFEELMSSLDFLPAPVEELANGQAEKMETSIITCGKSIMM